jgi:hypothetical protein
MGSAALAYLINLYFSELPLRLVQSSFPVVYLVKANYRKMSTEKRMAFCLCHEDASAAKINLAVSSMEYCCCLFDKHAIWIRLGGCCRQTAMIPP